MQTARTDLDSIVPLERRPAPRRLAWRLYLVGSLMAIALHFVLPPRLQSLVYDGIGLSALVAIVCGIRRHQPTRALGWWLMFAGQACFFAGDITWNVYQDVFHIALPSPSLADALYIAGYPVLMVGLLVMARGRSEHRPAQSVIDAAIVATGCGLAVWIFAINPLEGAALHSSAVFVSLVYPIMDIPLVGALALLMFAPGERTPSFRLIVGAMLFLLAGDITYAIVLANSGSLSGSPWSLGWLLCYVLLGTAALHPSMTAAFEATTNRWSERLTRTRLALLGGIALGPFVLYAVMTAAGASVDVTEILTGSTFLLALIAVRVAWLLRELERANLRLDRLQEERGRVLEDLVRASEDERKLLAADLHDGPVQKLAAVVMMLETAGLRDRRGDEEGAQQLHQRATEAVATEVAALRRTMVELRPPALDEQGLPAALSDLALRLGQRHIECAVESGLEGRFDVATETVLYRVAQEALANVAKHSRAGHARVRLGRRDGTLSLEVTDDGAGFDSERTPTAGPRGHLGIETMRERVRMAGGRFELISTPGHGTRVRVLIPVVEAA